jgi:flagellar protein FliO/FliZ
VASRGGGRIPGTGNGGGPLSILAQLTLGKDQRLVLVQAGQRYLLLGVTSAQVTTLAEFTQQEAESWQAACPAESAPPSFGQALRIVLKQKGRR